MQPARKRSCKASPQAVISIDQTTPSPDLGEPSTSHSITTPTNANLLMRKSASASRIHTNRRGKAFRQEGDTSENSSTSPTSSNMRPADVATPVTTAEGKQPLGSKRIAAKGSGRRAATIK